MMDKTMTVSKTTFPIDGYAIPTVNGYKISTQPIQGSIPILSIPMMSDYKWQQECLKSRLKHPERYSEYEDVNATIAKLRKWLDEHEPK
ncbi:MAG: hypothetical protein ACI4HO_03865 [Ruminococcus sp.]